MRTIHKFHRGAVSLFMVIFSMLVITIVTVGFLRIMTADQRQATANDLSQSAYDSALAGVEDAKRALLKYQRDCIADSTKCGGTFKEALKSDTCNAAVTRFAGVAETSNGEVLVQQSTGSVNDRNLNQAYTCVTVTPDTEDYVGTLGPNEQVLIPLRAANGTFDRVVLSWFSREKDVKSASGDIDRAPVAGMAMLAQDRWPDNRPPVMRTQLMQFGPDFLLSDFDAETTSGESNANTAFLYPTSSNVNTMNIATNDGRRAGSAEYPSQASATNTPYPASCRANVSAGGYACEMTVILPRAIGSTSDARTAYLRLVSLYKGTSFKVELRSGDSNTPVLFDGVQPAIDSTGRANDLFRRVKARVNLEAASFPFPEAAVDVADNFCKDFTVTPEQYITGTCRP